MKTSIIALFVLGLSSSAFAERINFLAEKVQTFKAKENLHAKDHYTIHTQAKFKTGGLGEVRAHKDGYYDTVKFHELDHAQRAQVELLKKLERQKLDHNAEHFKNVDRQIAEIHTWIEKTTNTWTTTDRVPE